MTALEQQTVAGVGRIEPVDPEPLVAGDSCRHDLLVSPPGEGESFRPTTWVWWAPRTRRILAWWSGTAKEVDLGVTTALRGLIATHGAPSAVILDIGRASEMKGVERALDELGVRLEHRAGSSHGHGLERALHGINTAINRRAREVGALDWDVFTAVLGAAVAAHNEAVSHA